MQMEIRNEKERGSILLRAMHTINGERQQRHGTPEDSASYIASLWNAYLGARLNGELEPHDVHILMALFKIARIRNGSGHMDSYVDAAGYLGLAADEAEKTVKESFETEIAVEKDSRVGHSPSKYWQCSPNEEKNTAIHAGGMGHKDTRY